MRELVNLPTQVTSIVRDAMYTLTAGDEDAVLEKAARMYPLGHLVQ